jgi:predicted glycogen debranching enzyme
MSQVPLDGGVAIRSTTRPDVSMSLISDGPAYRSAQDVYYSFEYEEERRRGLAWTEDLYSPGCFEMRISGDAAFAIIASTWRSSMLDWQAEFERERARQSYLKAPIQKLRAASDSFLAKRGNSLSIIAGYHWFDDWGRDAMISLPGLLLTADRTNEAAMVLRSFAAAMKNGVLPNDLGARSYNTVDASLWFVRAVSRYFEHSRDRRFLKEIWPSIMEVFRRYSEPGEDFGSDEDGLISCRPALTWMDARLDGRPVTPRAGKCCEINALWYSALVDMNRFYQELEKGRRDGHPEISSLLKRVRESYEMFWNSETGCLYDVIDPEDASIRPNQIIAAGIDGLMPKIKRESVFEVVTRDLLTPFGLRTLSPSDSRYIGRYEGDPRKRDGSYHQGTVWPWLIGPYIDALLSIKGRKRKVLSSAREILNPLVTLQSTGIETIPEVFDGDLPQRPGGCISQAWSVAEVLRAWQASQ